MQEERILPPVKVRVLERKKSQGVMVLTVMCIVCAALAFGPAGWLTAKGILAEGLIGLLCDGPWIVLGIIFLVIAMGTNSEKRWAWILALVFGILGLSYAILNLAAMSTIPAEFRPLAFTLLVVLNLVFDALVVVMAIMVRDRFKKEEYRLPWMPPSPMM